MMEETPQQAELGVFAERRPVVGFDPRAGVCRYDHQPMVIAGPQNASRPQADGHVQRLGPFVKEVQRPDVHRAARQIDARWC
jgi:hypothetical protein